ncbi:hypothetical protein [Methylobacterium crusticola]|uniref:hypothetical protein n=1 Tax=Methylobacterium crusticola TaxID=1697972 RepID=UPI001EE27320|nr:hypothetical protein [Methylobacterium crusticola]
MPTAIKGDRQHHGGLAARAVSVGADEHAADRPRHEAHPECCDRRQKADPGIAGREESPADRHGEERVRGEVVEFERVAYHGRHHAAASRGEIRIP